MLDVRFETLLCLEVDHIENIQAMKFLVVPTVLLLEEKRATYEQEINYLGKFKCWAKTSDTARTIKQRLTRVLGIMDKVNGCLKLIKMLFIHVDSLK